MNASRCTPRVESIHALVHLASDDGGFQRSPWETAGEYRVRLVLDEALVEWRAQGSLAPHTAMAMATQLIAVCAYDPQATWCALSLLDQFHRRKVIATELFRYLKEELSRSALAPA